MVFTGSMIPLAAETCFSTWVAFGSKSELPEGNGFELFAGYAAWNCERVQWHGEGFALLCVDECHVGVGYFAD